MREQAKPTAFRNGGGGISTGNAYRCGVKSAATDLEALIDAYGLHAVLEYASRIHSDLIDFGDSKSNALYNLELNALPFPKVRKQNKNKGKKRAGSKEK